MSDLDSTTPRVFLARHGETEWTINGRYTGTTELDLTLHGVKQTFQHLFGGTDLDEEKAVLTEDIAEWDYGDYEGMLVDDIRKQRKDKGLDQEREWSIWRDGCEGGESSRQVTERLDRLISQIHDVQRPYMHGEKPVDVVLVAHGLSLRCFVKRWLKLELDAPLPMMLSPGAIGVLSYRAHNIDEPAFFVGLALPARE